MIEEPVEDPTFIVSITKSAIEEDLMDEPACKNQGTATEVNESAVVELSSEGVVHEPTSAEGIGEVEEEIIVIEVNDQEVINEPIEAESTVMINKEVTDDPSKVQQPQRNVSNEPIVIEMGC